MDSYHILLNRKFDTFLFKQTKNTENVNKLVSFTSNFCFLPSYPRKNTITVFIFLPGRSSGPGWAKLMRMIPWA